MSYEVTINIEFVGLTVARLGVDEGMSKHSTAGVDGK